MAVNLKGMNAGQLLSLRHQIDAALEGMKKELEAQLVQIGAISGPRIKRTKLTVRRSKLTGRKVAPKYRNPDNRSETWAGRGMKPKWLATALKGGKKLEHFAVKK
jgi:DNA-binding protein H-NS